MAKMPDMNQVMKLAQGMAKQMEEKLDAIKVEGNSGGGMVKVSVNGHKNILSLEISKEVVDINDLEMLQDLIIAAVNDAQAKIDEKMKNDLGFPMGGFPFNAL